MTRMWVGTVYIISGLSLSLLIFSGCQQHFGDPSEQVSSQTRHCTNTVRSLTHSQMPGMDKKKLILIQDHAPNFVHLKVENHHSAQVAPTCQDLEQDSGTASQILLQCMKSPHKHRSFLACSASEMCPASGSAFQTRPRAGWSSCFTFAFQYHPPLLSVAGDTQGGPWGTFNFTTNTSTVSKVEKKIHGYARHWNGYSSRESI